MCFVELLVVVNVFILFVLCYVSDIIQVIISNHFLLSFSGFIRFGILVCEVKSCVEDVQTCRRADNFDSAVADSCRQF